MLVHALLIGDWYFSSISIATIMTNSYMAWKIKKDSKDYLFDINDITFYRNDPELGLVPIKD